MGMGVHQSRHNDFSRTVDPLLNPTSRSDSISYLGDDTVLNEDLLTL
jgi:hypothetical protein